MSGYTWKQVKNEVVLPILKDEVDPNLSSKRQRHNPQHLIGWWNAAQARLATMKPLHKHQIYRNDGVVVPLPERHYKPRALYLRGVPTPLPRSTIEEQYVRTKTQPCYYIHENNLVVAGIGSPKEVEFLYAYYGYYKRIINDDSIVEVPLWAHEACGIYVALQAIQREALDTSRFNKFKTKVDSGNPEQNPFIPILKWLEKRFIDIIRLHADDDEDYRQ